MTMPKRTVSRRTWVISAIAAVAVLVASIVILSGELGAHDEATSTAAPAAASVASPGASPVNERKVIEATWGDETVRLVKAGQTLDLPPAVPVAGGLLAKFEVTKGDAQYLRMLDVYLYRMTDPTVGVTGANVSAWSLMILMGHGGVDQQGEDLGNGHYRVPLQFTMPGVWQVDITIATGTEKGTVSLDIPAWE